MQTCHEEKSVYFWIWIIFFFCGRVQITRIVTAKCDLFLHYREAKEISFYYFVDTKLCAKEEKTQMNSIYVVGMFVR